MPTAANNALTLQFLEWVRSGPRTHAQIMETWRTSCPRMAIWEDALADGLVGIKAEATSCAARVILTQRGENMLAEHAHGG